MSKKIEKTDIDPTLKIIIPNQKDDIENELRELTKEALLQRLNFEETDPKVIKLIKKIIKEK